MRFEHPGWLLGTLLALAVGALLLLGAHQGVRALRRFGQQDLMVGLMTARPAGRRALKGVALVLALCACFIALAQPQYGWGTRRIPATNLDVILVLDYSKSMYARDVAPSRIERAKSEVARLIAALPGARFGAVAFAGEPMSFPLTSDGGAIAQFFRQLTPHDMPVGGTAIARALQAGRALLERDPRSQKHRRVMLLITDGEDLEGDPVASAQSAKQAGITISVVQIGGRAPEIIPDIDESGANRGVRRDRDGKVMTTALSAEGEAQLASIAESTGGSIVRSEAGSTGIDEVARQLRVMMTQELSERVETVYADVYAYPLGVALVLFLLESLVGEVPRRRRQKKLPKAAVAAAALFLLFGCREPSSSPVDSLFMRNAPEVDEAIEALSRGDAGAAQVHLAGYLGISPCSEGTLATAGGRDKPQAAFDLGLALFRIAERYGARFGEDLGASQDEAAQLARRSQEVGCALAVVEPLVSRRDLPVEMRAQAAYLLGNLEFLRREYEAAVQGYDQSLVLIPGVEGEPEESNLGRDAAHNRALALRRIEENPPPERPDAGPPPAGDAGGGSDGSEQPPDDSPSDQSSPDDDRDEDEGEQPPDDPDGNDDEQKDSQGKEPPGDEPKQDPQQQSADREQPRGSEQGAGQPPAPKPEPGPSLSQDDRVLDQLERAPTVQQEAARARRVGVRRGVADK